jgi:hypothetical protein
MYNGLSLLKASLVDIVAACMARHNSLAGEPIETNWAFAFDRLPSLGRNKSTLVLDIFQG